MPKYRPPPAFRVARSRRTGPSVAAGSPGPWRRTHPCPARRPAPRRAGGGRHHVHHVHLDAPFAHQLRGHRLDAEVHRDHLVAPGCPSAVVQLGLAQDVAGHLEEGPWGTGHRYRADRGPLDPHRKRGASVADRVAVDRLVLAARQLVDQGESVTAAARRVGVPRSTLYRHLARGTVEPPGPELADAGDCAEGPGVGSRRRAATGWGEFPSRGLAGRPAAVHGPGSGRLALCAGGGRAARLRSPQPHGAGGNTWNAQVLPKKFSLASPSIIVVVNGGSG